MKRFNTLPVTVAVASLFFAITLMSGGVAGAVPVITNGLVAAYEFNGNANDVSGNGNNGVVNGATLTADRFGNLDSAYHFDGIDDYIVSSEGIDPLADGAISFWFIDSSSPGQGGTFLASQDTANYQPGDLLIGNEESGDLFRAIYWGGDHWEGFGSVDLTTGVWTHAVLSWNSTAGTTLYINGLQTDSVIPTVSTTAPHTIFAGNPLNFGRTEILHFTTWLYDYGEATIDDVYIYNRALSPTEVSTLYSVVPEPNTALLLGLGLSALAVRREKR